MDGSVMFGVALHDLENRQSHRVGDSWILQPEDPWEITGYVHNVVFTCGAVLESDGTVKIYWGAQTRSCAWRSECLGAGRTLPHHGRPQSKHGISKSSNTLEWF